MSSVQSILLIYFSYMFLRASLPNLDAFISLTWMHQLLTYWLFGLIFLVGLFLNFYGFIKLVESGRTLLGLATIKNFDKPWMAKSFGEFWRRWHISLGVLIRQILFNPLAIFFGRKYGAKVGIALASFISFLLLGLWHGQSIFFLYFGIIQGGMVAIEGYLSIRLRAVLFFLINPISFCIFSYGFFAGK
jgi:D-alanyl-lipoteichoic acid acyltransferase DltB (MBOAT superfamily)